MTTYTITINARALKAVAMCASNEETRYYLKGVFIETDKLGVTMTATDGHRLAVLNHKRHADDIGAESVPSVILPLHMLDKLKIGKRSQDYATLTIEPSSFPAPHPAKLTLSFNGLSVTSDAVDGTYPNARQIVRGAFSSQDRGKLAQFNPAYVAAFGKMKELLTGGKPAVLQVYHNGDSPALVDFLGVEETAEGLCGFGVIMPCRSTDGVLNILAAPPAWYDAEPAPTAETVAA